jgi:hypothetical protein
MPGSGLQAQPDLALFRLKKLPGFGKIAASVSLVERLGSVSIRWPRRWYRRIRPIPHLAGLIGGCGVFLGFVGVMAVLQFFFLLGVCHNDMLLRSSTAVFTIRRKRAG